MLGREMRKVNRDMVNTKIGQLARDCPNHLSSCHIVLEIKELVVVLIDHG